MSYRKISKTKMTPHPKDNLLNLKEKKSVLRIKIG
jgi:hypothetical protein